MKPVPSDSLLRLQADLWRRACAGPARVQGVFETLVHPDNLRAAWDRVRAADGADSPGPDGVRCRDVEPDLEAWLGALRTSLVEATWRPGPARSFSLDRGPGRAPREIAVLDVRDRVVHAALKQVLEPVVEPTFHPRSFGYRPGRSVPAALEAVTAALAAATPDARVETFDVVDCFPNLDHGRILARLRRRFGERELIHLLERALEVQGRRRLTLRGPRRVGLLQGSALSPLLCNVLLDAFDQAAAGARGSTARVFRYADDMLAIGTPDELERAQRSLRRVGRRLGLALEPRVSASPAEAPVPWLGVELVAVQREWEDARGFGYRVPAGKVRDMLARINEMTEPPSERIEVDAFDMGRWIASVNEQLESWHQAYAHAEGARAVFEAIDRHAFERVERLLARSRRGRGRGPAPSTVRQPRGFRTLEANGVPLTVLCALPPRCPQGLTRRPRWTRKVYRTPAGVTDPGLALAG